MKAPILVLCLLLLGSTGALAQGSGGNCPEGQVEKAFHDGASVTYQCLDAASSGMIDDTNIQYGGEGEENTTGGSSPPEESGGGGG